MDRIARLSAMETQCDRLIRMLGSDFDHEILQQNGPASQPLLIYYEGSPFTIRGCKIDNSVRLQVVFYNGTGFTVKNSENVPIFNGRVTSSYVNHNNPTDITDISDIRTKFSTEETRMRIKMEYNTETNTVSSVSFTFSTTTWLTNKMSGYWLAAHMSQHFYSALNNVQ